MGAAFAVALRRALGEPGLWTAVVLGAGVSLVLLSGASFHDALWLALRGLQALGRLALQGLYRLSTGMAAVFVFLYRRGGPALASVVRRVARAVWAASDALVRWTGAVVRDGVRRILAARQARAQTAGLDPILASAGGIVVEGRRPAFEAALRGASREAVEKVPDLPRPSEASDQSAVSSEPGSEQDGEDEVLVQAMGAELDAPPEAAVLDAEAVSPAASLPVTVEAAAAKSGRAAGASRRRKVAVVQEALPFPPAAARAYTLPDLSLLDAFAAKAKAGKVDPEEVARALERTLQSFGVEAKVIRWEAGPVVTRYELQPAPGVKVQKITSLQNDIALALAASSVRLEAPIPGKSAVGVELPNERASLVHLREVLASDEFRAATSPLGVAVGKSTSGAPVVADLVAMPHLLIAGATGAGKSVMLNAMIASMLFRSTPEQVRFLMIDPKRVELTNYNGIPHLLSPVVTGPREAAAKLRWAIQEMEGRYEMFAGDGVRNIQAFNAQHPDRPLAYIVIIVDELADLMMVAPADFEEIICRLAQMTRATGIHLLVATQRPSVDVITGLIKANIPSRIAFAVSSLVDSRTILDHPGAERLLGKGDMLFAPIGATRPMRVQGAFISDAETERLVEFWRAQGEPAYVEALLAATEPAPAEEGAGDDALLVDAARLIVRSGYASVSLLQRKMRIGYVRAARVVDQLEEKGIVGPSQGSSPRDVLVGIDDLERVLRSGVQRPAADGTDEA
ncbi:MAG TPA: DNA translocase FtsK [bacterium]|nr:DNA translocase FtsK [bacterium]